MKILFLDIDGVLNSAQSVIMYSRYDKKDLWEKRRDGFCPIAMSNLNYILERCPDVNVVISSAWRIYYDIDKLKTIFAHFKFINVDRIIGYTPAKLSNHYRGNEIGWWLERNKKVEKFAILDDNDDMGDYVSWLFQTNMKTGLTFDIAEKIIEHFNGKKEKTTIV